MGEIVWWLLKAALGGVLSYVTPRFLVALGVPLDRWVVAMASWAVHIDREAALWTASFIMAALLYGGSVYLSKDHDWRPTIPETIRKLWAKVEPSHVIILGLAIALGGVVWQWRREAPIDPNIAKLQSQLEDAQKQIALLKKAEVLPSSQSKSAPTEAVTSRYRWEPLTNAEITGLRSKLRNMPKPQMLSIRCGESDCRELADSFMDLFSSLGWQPSYEDQPTAWKSPTGIAVLYKDGSYDSIADALETATEGRLKIDSQRYDPAWLRLAIGKKPS
jgi:hypothetical protein